MTNILSISVAAGPYTISMKELGEYVAKTYGSKSLPNRKFGFLVREDSISYKHSVVPDFIPDYEDGILFTAELRDPDTKSRMKVFQEKALEISKNTAEKSLEKAGLKPDEITHIITTTCTGLLAPGLEILLTEALGLNKDIIRYGINFMGCYAAFHAMRLADTIIKSAPESKVLIVCTELCSLHYRIDEADDNILSTYLFSDGCASVIMSGGHSSQTRLELVDLYTTLIPEGQADMAWHVGNHGFEMILSKNIPIYLKNNLKKAVEILLNKNNVKMEAIQKYAIHPGGKSILKAFEEALLIDGEQLEESYEILKQYGNMSSATVLFVLEKMLYSAEDEDNQYIYSAAFGPGLTVESALLKKIIQPSCL